MVEGVDTDARGIVAPDVGLTRFRLERFDPSPAVGRLVDRYWTVRWDLPAGEIFDQQVWPHPVTNVVFENGTATAGGVNTVMFTRRLEGAGHVLGVMFRPAGFRPLLGAPMRAITDVTIPFEDVVGPRVRDLVRAVSGEPDDAAAAATADAFLMDLIPGERHPAEETAHLVETAAAHPHIVRVEQLAELAGVSPRTLQRRFADHVGLSPKKVIRRYRLYDAAEAARQGDVDWAGLAIELGYSDQAHLTRDFRDAMGIPPAIYARTCRPEASVRR